MQKVKYEGQEFNPSPYQIKIFENIEHGTSNMVINAVAGSGKSTTIVNALSLIPQEKKILFIAFNKDIVEALKKKVGEMSNVDIMTYHSLGYSFIRENLKEDIEVDEYKYLTHVHGNVHRKENMNYTKFMSYQKNILKLIDYARFNLAQSEKEIEQVAKKYNVNIVDDECSVVVEILKWGKTVTNRIDYTDMIWLPYELDIKTRKHKYDWIFVDEAQDSSLVQQELFKKCFKRGARFCAVGDSSQCINAWAGADENAFSKFLKMPNTKEFSLPISYRCPVSVINLAKKFVPQIEAKENAVFGEVKYDVNPYNPKPGDMVLCRNTFPLVKLYTEYLRINKKSFIRGKDIGDDFIDLIDKHTPLNNDMLNKSLIDDGLFRNLYEHLFKVADLMMENNGMTEEEAYLSEPVMNIYDSIMSLETLSEGLTTVDELKNKIKTIFAEGGNEAVCLSTIHKAKGLEADNVYILAKSLMPSQFAKQEWELKSEENLTYVAITRAKQTLQYISEEDFRLDRGRVLEVRVKNKLKNIRQALGTKPSNIRKTNITVTWKTSINTNNDTASNTNRKTIGAMKFNKFLKK